MGILRWAIRPGLQDALLVFVLLAGVYGYFYQDPAWNGNSRFALTYAFVERGTFVVDGYIGNPARRLDSGDVSVVNGQTYSDKAIGSSLVAALVYLPLYWGLRLTGGGIDPEVLKQILTFFALSVPAALCGVLIYQVCAQIGQSRLRALVVSAAVGLGTLILPYSVTFFGHVLAGVFLFAAFFLMLRLKQSPGPGGNAVYAGVGLLLGLALITEFTTAMVVLLLGVYYLDSLRGKKSAFLLRVFLLPVLGALVPLGMMLAYNRVCFGSALAIGYNNLVNPEFQAGMAGGLMGIGRPTLRVLFYETFHPAMGLFWQSPVLLMALVGGFAGLRRAAWRAEVLLAGAAAGAYLLMNAGYFMWWGGDAVGPRALIPMLALLSIPLALVPRRLFGLVAGLGLVSFVQMLLAAASTVMVPLEQVIPTLKQAGLFTYSTLYNYCWWKLSNGVFGVNLGEQLLGLEGWASLAPLAVFLALWVGLAVRRFGRGLGCAQEWSYSPPSRPLK